MKCRSLFVLIAVYLFVLGCNQKKSSQERPPNIIFILADDLGYGDLSFTGQTHFSTPHIDQLAKDGMFFSQHYSGSTVCAPSRSVLLTGKHTGHTFIRGNQEVQPEGQFPLPSGEITLSSLLQANGYTTGAFGKWGLGYPRSSGDPINQGFDEFYGYNCQRIGHNYYPYHLWDNLDSVPLTGNEGNQTEEYAPELIQKRALTFIKKNKDVPFFLYLPTIIPHAELAAPQHLIDSFTNIYGLETPFEGVDDGPKYKNGAYGSQEHPHAAFAAMVTLLDRHVGEIRKTLEENDISENTLIIFTSDNGPHKEGGADPDFFDSNGIYRGYKRDLYEGGIRVPTFAVWPSQIKPGQTISTPSAFWDWLPTFCELTNTNIPSSIDGISLVPALTGKDQDTHEFFYWEFHEQGGRQAVLYDGWKGIRQNLQDNPNGPIELYDIKNDPSESNDVSADHPDIVATINNFMIESHNPSPNFLFAWEKNE